VKRCAKCDFEYDDAYDGCPQCARTSATAPPPSSTVRCPKCEKDYDSSYAHCPTCAAAAVLQPKTAAAKRGSSGCGATLVVFVVIALLFAWFGSCSSSGSGSGSSADNPALASKASAALAAAGGSAAIHDVTAYGTDHVVVTINVTIDALGGKVLAEDAGQGVAGAVFLNVPEATDVMVYDADRSLIDIYRRK